MTEPHPPGNYTITRKLPSEILFFQILPKLPVTSLPNFMCVCKKWHSFLKSSVFANTYHHHHQNHPKYLLLSTCRIQKKYRSIDCESPKDGLTAVRTRPSFWTLHYSDTPELSILTSLHGLLCVGISELSLSPEYSDLILWNPLTGEHKMLSKKGSSHEECYKNNVGLFGLYYISSDDDYKLLRVTEHQNIYIYTLRSDSWRKVESTEDFQQMASNLTSSRNLRQRPVRHILLHEKLYFLNQVDRIETFIKTYSIVRFDTKTEIFTEIAMPSFGNQMTDCLDFMVQNGCLHFCVAILIEKENYMPNRSCYEMIECWRMDEDGDWTKVLTYGPMSFFIWGRSLLHLMRNGNFLIQHLSNVYVLDIKNHTKEMVFACEKIDYDHSTDGTGKFIETIPPMGKYIETTLSPHQYDVTSPSYSLPRKYFCIIAISLVSAIFGPLKGSYSFKMINFRILKDTYFVS
ncbi:hypothetical protein L1887_31729 [Cichorium endivia]|nr:hypothetical protein L1887_31729 [Cichorium endivia]